MAKPSILLACIGNIFHGDDAFGVEAAKVLATRDLPENVKLVDYGIRGFDLAFALVDGYDITIFVDAMQRGELPERSMFLNRIWTKSAVSKQTARWLIRTA